MAMARVFKYTLKMEQRQTVSMPADSTLLSVQVQRGVVCIWAIVNPDPELDEVPRSFEIVGTGHEVPSPSKFIGTVQIGEFVWHIFEIPNP
jgi:hypothetical protein